MGWDETGWSFGVSMINLWVARECKITGTCVHPPDTSEKESQIRKQPQYRPQEGTLSLTTPVRGDDKVLTFPSRMCQEGVPRTAWAGESYHTLPLS